MLINKLQLQTLQMIIRATGTPARLSTPRMSIPRVVWAGVLNLAMRRVATARQNGSDEISHSLKNKINKAEHFI